MCTHAKPFVISIQSGHRDGKCVGLLILNCGILFESCLSHKISKMQDQIVQCRFPHHHKFHLNPVL